MTFQIKEGACRTRSGDKVNAKETSKKSYNMRLMEGIFKISEIQDCHINGISPKKIAENPDIADDLIDFIQDNLISSSRRQS